MCFEVSDGDHVGRLDERGELLEGLEVLGGGRPRLDGGLEVFEFLDDGGRGGLRLVPETGGRDLGV